MRFLVVQTHQRGIPLTQREIMQMPGVVGQLLTESTTNERFKGTIVVARLRGEKDAGRDSNELLPCLWGPVLQILSIQGLLLSGHERIEERGRVRDYVQGWWARLP